MPLQYREHYLSRLQVYKAPHSDPGVETSRSQPLAVTAQGQAAHVSKVPVLDGQNLFARLQVPSADGPVRTRGEQPIPAAVHYETPDVLGMPMQSQRIVRFQIPYLDGTVATAREQAFAVIGQGQAVNDWMSHGVDFLAGFQVPHVDSAALVSRDQTFPIAVDDQAADVTGVVS